MYFPICPILEVHVFPMMVITGIYQREFPPLVFPAVQHWLQFLVTV